MGRTVGPVRVGGPVRASRIRPNTIFSFVCCIEKLTRKAIRE